MSCNNIHQTILSTNTQKILVEIVSSAEDRARGLMNRETLEPNTGMLFIFKHSKKHGFWMKNTRIPLDIIWISADKKIVDIQTATPCKTIHCPTYTPNTAAQFVLEVNAHTFKGSVGDTVYWE